MQYFTKRQFQIFANLIYLAFIFPGKILKSHKSLQSVLCFTLSSLVSSALLIRLYYSIYFSYFMKLEAHLHIVILIFTEFSTVVLEHTLTSNTNDNFKEILGLKILEMLHVFIKQNKTNTCYPANLLDFLFLVSCPCPQISAIH